MTLRMLPGGNWSLVVKRSDGAANVRRRGRTDGRFAITRMHITKRDLMAYKTTACAYEIVHPKFMETRPR